MDENRAMKYSPEAHAQLNFRMATLRTVLRELARDRAKLHGRTMVEVEDVDAVLVEACNTVAADADART